MARVCVNTNHLLLTFRISRDDNKPGRLIGIVLHAFSWRRPTGKDLKSSPFPDIGERGDVEEIVVREE